VSTPLARKAARSAVRRQGRAIAFLGAALAIAGVRFFTDPTSLERTAVGVALHGYYDEAWSAFYIVGGVLIVYGSMRPSPRAELPGIILAIWGLGVNGVAIILVRGIDTATGQLPLYLIAVWVLLGRRHDLRALAERRHDAPDPRPPDQRVERRRGDDPHDVFALVPIAGVVGGSDVTTVLVALMSGGVVSALAQWRLYRPQERDLIARAADAASSAAERMLKQSQAQLDSAHARIDELEADLQAARDDLRRSAARERDLTSTCERLERRLRALETGEHDVVPRQLPPGDQST
jgi:hypothetical protein